MQTSKRLKSRTRPTATSRIDDSIMTGELTGKPGSPPGVDPSLVTIALLPFGANSDWREPSARPGLSVTRANGPSGFAIRRCLLLL